MAEGAPREGVIPGIGGASKIEVPTGKFAISPANMQLGQLALGSRRLEAKKQIEKKKLEAKKEKELLDLKVDSKALLPGDRIVLEREVADYYEFYYSKYKANPAKYEKEMREKAGAIKNFAADGKERLTRANKALTEGNKDRSNYYGYEPEPTTEKIVKDEYGTHVEGKESRYFSDVSPAQVLAGANNKEIYEGLSMNDAARLSTQNTDRIYKKPELVKPAEVAQNLMRGADALEQIALGGGEVDEHGNVIYTQKFNEAHAKATVKTLAKAEWDSNPGLQKYFEDNGYSPKEGLEAFEEICYPYLGLPTLKETPKSKGKGRLNIFGGRAKVDVISEIGQTTGQFGISTKPTGVKETKTTHLKDVGKIATSPQGFSIPRATVNLGQFKILSSDGIGFERQQESRDVVIQNFKTYRTFSNDINIDVSKYLTEDEATTWRDEWGLLEPEEGKRYQVKFSKGTIVSDILYDQMTDADKKKLTSQGLFAEADVKHLTGGDVTETESKLLPVTQGDELEAELKRRLTSDDWNKVQARYMQTGSTRQSETTTTPAAGELVEVTNPNGDRVKIKKSQLKAALKIGYTQ